MASGSTNIPINLSESSNTKLSSSQSLNYKITPVKLSNDIKELSNTALLSSIQLYDDSIKIDSSVLKSKHSNSKSLSSLLFLKSNQNSNRLLSNTMLDNVSTSSSANSKFSNDLGNKSNKISNQVGTTNKLTDLSSYERKPKQEHDYLLNNPQLTQAYLNTLSNLSSISLTNSMYNKENNNQALGLSNNENSSSSILFVNHDENNNDFDLIDKNKNSENDLSMSIDHDEEDPSSNYTKQKGGKNHRRSALAWVGRTVGK